MILRPYILYCVRIDHYLICLKSLPSAANSAAHLDCLRGKHGPKQGFEESELATRHYVLALGDIRRRFEDPNIPVTDGLMSAVTGMICHNVCLPTYHAHALRLADLLPHQETIGNFESWKVHTQGLWMLIARRGGLHAIVNTNLRLSMSW